MPVHLETQCKENQESNGFSMFWRPFAETWQGQAPAAAFAASHAAPEL